MPLFDYTGQLQSGSAFQGTLEAESQEDADRILAEMGVRVVTLRPVRTTGYVAPLSLDDFLFLNEQIAAMTQASVPMPDGLRQLAADVGSRKVKRVVLELADELESGTTLDQALTKLRDRFPTQYAGVVQAGLKTGNLGGVLYGLTTHLRLKSELRRALIELGLYPLVVLAFAFGILTFLMRYVVPQFDVIMKDFGVIAVPGLTEILIDTARAWPTVELVALGLVLAAVLLAVLLRLPGFRAARERFVRAVPGLSQVYWSSVLARFTHTSALGAFSGTPLPELIASAGAASGSVALAGTTRRIADKLVSGSTLEQAAQGERDIPALWTCVVSVTAGRGELPATLEELARNYELRAREWSGIVRTLFGPVLLVFIGLILGSCIVGLLLPMVSLIQGLTA